MQKLSQKHTKKINLSLELFEQSIKSKYTRKVYIVCLKKYFQFPGSSKFVECDHTTDPRNVEKHIIDYIISLKKEVLEAGKNSAVIRKEVPICHGFRKFFSSQLVETEPNVKPELRWRLEGHGLKANGAAYVKTSEKRLQHEYEKGIDNLTIDPSNRQKREIEVLKIEKSRFETIIKDVEQLKRKYNRLKA